MHELNGKKDVYIIKDVESVLHCSEVLVTLTGQCCQSAYSFNQSQSICVINKSYHAVNAYLISALAIVLIPARY